MPNDPEVLRLVREMHTAAIPFNAVLGIRLDQLEHGRARMIIPFRPELIGDPRRPALHGGVISALIDTCGGAAVMSMAQRHDRVSTIDLRIDYLRPGRAEDLIAEAVVVRLGNRVGVVSARAFHGSTPDDSVADGRGVYNINRDRGEAKPA